MLFVCYFIPYLGSGGKIRVLPLTGSGPAPSGAGTGMMTSVCTFMKMLVAWMADGSGWNPSPGALSEVCLEISPRLGCSAIRDPRAW